MSKTKSRIAKTDDNVSSTEISKNILLAMDNTHALRILLRAMHCTQWASEDSELMNFQLAISTC